MLLYYNKAVVIILQQIEPLSADSVSIVAKAEEQPSISKDVPPVTEPIECNMSEPMSEDVENTVEPGSFCAAGGGETVRIQETAESCQSKESGPTQKEAKGNWRKRKFQDVSTLSDFTKADDMDGVCKK